MKREVSMAASAIPCIAVDSLKKLSDTLNFKPVAQELEGQ